jgi:flagellar biosynthesis protein FliQ
VVVFIVIVVSLPWAISQLTTFTQTMFEHISRM